MNYIQIKVLRLSIYSIDAYRYDRAVYINGKTPMIVTCPDHGDFPITPDNFLYRAGCTKCRGVHPRGYPAQRDKVEKRKPGRTTGELRLILTRKDDITQASLTSINPQARAVDLQRHLLTHAKFSDPTVARAARKLLNATPDDLNLLRGLLPWI